jgi:hypothetical protein
MRSVSEAFRAKIKDSQRVEHIRGKVGTIDFDDSNVLHMGYQNQCSDTKDVTLGSARIGQLTATFWGLNIPRYSWRGLPIKLDYGLEIDDEGTIEWVDDLLTGTIGKAEWTASGVNITAYDCLANLDAPINFEQTSGQIFGMLTLLSNDTGVLLGITEEECAALPNGTEILGLIQPNDITTYRDFVSSIATVVGGFATATGDGKLTIRSFADSEVVFKFEAKNRVAGSVFSDYVTNYDGIVITDASTGASMYYFAEDAADGISINIGSNALLQFGTEEVKTAQRQRLAEVAHSIAYVPFQLAILNCPVFELGDLIECEGGVAGSETITCCVMAIDWTFKATTTMQGFGADPNLTAGKSRTDKALTTALKQSKESGITYYPYINTTAVSLTTTAQRLYRIAFATADTTDVELWHEVKWNVTTENNTPVEITYEYYLDGVKFDYEPVDTWTDGYHSMPHPYWLLEVSGGETHYWEVRAKINGGSAVASIGDVHALLKGQKLVGQVKFDGNIKIQDTYTPWSRHRRVASLTDNVLISKIVVNPDIEITDTYIPWTRHRTIATLTDSMSLTAQTVQYTRVLENEDTERVTEDGGTRITEV